MTTEPGGTTFAIRRMRRDDAGAVARLHRQGIESGFLSSLGLAFLRQLYSGIAASRGGFVFVAVEAPRHDAQTPARGTEAGVAGESVVGFVAGAEHVGRLYRSVLIRRGFTMIPPLARHLLRPSTVRRIVESLRYPSQDEGDYPEAELLSIAVAPEARGSGVAHRLVDALVDEFRRRGVASFKLIVGSRLERAQAFYRKYGFIRAGSIQSHGTPADVFVLTVPPDGGASA